MLSLTELLTPSPQAPSPLAFLLEAHANRTPTLILITGPSGAGKTACCRALEQFGREQGWHVAGLLSPAILEDGRKVAIDLQDLQSGELRRLATRTQSLVDASNSAASTAGGSTVVGAGGMPPGGVTTGDWSFDPRTLRWGNDILGNITCPDLLLLDELGPLEFRQQQGLQAGMKLIDAWRCNLVCATVRPSLVGAARMRWPWSQILVVGEERVG